MLSIFPKINLGVNGLDFGLLRQGKRAEEAWMISLTNNHANKINGSQDTADLAFAA